jgi:hypothetical protein
MATRRKKLSDTTKLFIVIAIALAIIIILGGIPETAQFFKPSKMTLPTAIKGCVRGTPAMSPYNSPQYGIPGQALEFGFNYSIPDSADCNEATVEIWYNCPPELFCLWTRVKFDTLVPFNGTAGNKITSNMGTSPGTYNFTATITNLNNSESATTTAQYIVKGSGGGGGGGCLKPPCQVTQ